MVASYNRSLHRTRLSHLLYNNLTDRESWDQIEVLLAIEPGSTAHWGFSEQGRVIVDADGNSEWVGEHEGSHCFMVWSENSQKLAETIDRLMLEASGALPVSGK